MREDDRAVLRADIGTLAVELRWVMHLEEQIEQFFVADFRRVERDFHHFGVVGGAAANLSIVGVGDMAARVARYSVNHAGHFAEKRLDAPEASCSESGFF